MSVWQRVQVVSGGIQGSKYEVRPLHDVVVRV